MVEVVSVVWIKKLQCPFRDVQLPKLADVEIIESQTKVGGKISALRNNRIRPGQQSRVKPLSPDQFKVCGRYST